MPERHTFCVPDVRWATRHAVAGGGVHYGRRVKVTVLCQGGPPAYADRVHTDVDADGGGYVLFRDPAGDRPDAWYQVDLDAPPVATEHGEARVARYVADYLPS